MEYPLRMEMLFPKHQQHHHPLLYPLSITCLALVSLLTIPSILVIGRQVRGRVSKNYFYEDRDGKSEPEAVAAFCNRKPKAAILLFSLAGFGTSVAVTVLIAIDSRRGEVLENGLVTSSWALIVLQAVILMAVHAPVQVHNTGYWTFCSSAVTVVVTVLQIYNTFDRLVRHDDSTLVLQIINLLATFGTLFSSLLIPRRPVVFFRGEPVDAQWTCSILSRYTWTWVWPLIRLAGKKGDLEEKDVPQPDHTVRAEEVLADWHGYNFKGSLIREVLNFYKARLALQWSVTAVRCIIGVVPYWAMLSLIDSLEQRGGGGSPGRDLWGLVILLGVLSLIELWLDSWAGYYSITMISQPLRAQLSALVYEKSLRRKNVKSAEKPQMGEPSVVAAMEETDNAPLLTDGVNVTDDGGGKKLQDGVSPVTEGPSVLKSRQTIVNLVGVDSRRIADFAMYQFTLVTSIGKFVVYSAFLTQLIGWVPFMAGIIAWALILPVNTYFSKQYIRLSEELMSVRDKKLSVVNEALLGIRQIKFAALEKQWEKRIMNMRNEELKKTWRIFLGDTVLFSCWIISPIFLAAASLATYSVLHGELSASVAFTALSIFKSLEVILGALPDLLTTAFDTAVSLRRIDTYLKGPEMKKILTDGSDITFENAAIAWPSDENEVREEDRFILGGLNFTFPRGELSVISGKTGTGKSLVLSALIGEADVLEGKIFAPPAPSAFDRHDSKANAKNWILPGSVAFVAQTPWLEGASLRDNILFGLPLMEARYEEVLHVCALKKDLEILTDGDETELGANGINLSGGQKWRVTLARAIYSRAEILILDDIFSAVDAHVGRHIFEHCIGGNLCQGRTRILVTHHIGLVELKTKFLVELGDGRVLHAGLTPQLEEHGTLQLIKFDEQQDDHTQRDGTAKFLRAVNSEATLNADSGTLAYHGTKNTTGAKKFVQDETREKGHVKMRIYASYIKDCGGWPFWTICAILFAGFEASDLLRTWWVRIWTGSHGDIKPVIGSLGYLGYAVDQGLVHGFIPQNSLHYGPSIDATTGKDKNSLAFYLWVYVGISLTMGIVGTFRFYWSFLMSIKGSKVLYARILNTVLRSPLRWLDTVPVGRILNRLTSDFDIIDQRLTIDMSMLFWHILTLVGVCVAAALVSPYILPAIAMLIGVAAMIGRKYIDAARPLKRLESTSKSPVFELFNSTLAGISTLRAFQKRDSYIDQMYKRLDVWNSVSVCMWNMNRWMGFRMALVGAVFTTTIGAVVIMSPQVDAALAGFAISFALDFATNMIFAIRNVSQLELDMNAAERVIEYSELKTESQGGEVPPAAWPMSGRIEVEDLVVSYAEDLPPVLRGISFRVGDNERVGVIGRTGAGKSSLTLALFRFLEPSSGGVLIDGLDIAKLDLHSLRSRLAIIPQDPVLFSGTLRSNLDPFNERTDEELQAALARVQLTDSTAPMLSNESASAAPSVTTSNINIFRDLSSPVTESGENLSQGQRQLLCLARAITSRPKIMVLDEATSAVDKATDVLIQRSIREEFTSSTLLVIAHRLSTIVDFDRILVLDEGKVAEYGTPRELWEKDDGIFRGMCESSGERDQLELAIFGESDRESDSCSV